MRWQPVPSGYFYLEDADGQEIPGTRRDIGPHLNWDRAFAIRHALEARRGRDERLSYREAETGAREEPVPTPHIDKKRGARPAPPR